MHSIHVSSMKKRENQAKICVSIVGFIVFLSITVMCFVFYSDESHYEDKFDKNVCFVSNITVHQTFSIQGDNWVLTGNVLFNEAFKGYIDEDNNFDNDELLHNIATLNNITPVIAEIDKTGKESNVEMMIAFYNEQYVVCYTNSNKVHFKKQRADQGLLALAIIMLLFTVFQFCIMLNAIILYRADPNYQIIS